MITTMIPNYALQSALISLTDPLGGKINTVWDLVNNVLGVVLPLASILFVAMFVYAGFSYIMSTGDPGKVKSAQAMMTNAVIGLVIIAFAFVALALVNRGIGGA